MSCSHETCQCQIEGCGLTHPKNWKPTMWININDNVVGGDDPADCLAHYLLDLGYPRDKPNHLRKIAESQASRWAKPEGSDDESTPVSVSKPRRTVTQK